MGWQPRHPARKALLNGLFEVEDSVPQQPASITAALTAQLAPVRLAATATTQGSTDTVLEPETFVDPDTFPVAQTEVANATDDLDATVRRRARNLRIEQHRDELWLMARSLGQLARAEITRLDAALPNSPLAYARNRSQRDLLLALANGFEEIAAALADFAESKDQPLLLGKAGEIVDSLSTEVRAWWEKNRADAVDWCHKIPAIGMGIAVLEIFGVPTTLAAAISCAYIGGDKLKDIAKSFRD